jgi:AraC-like DNA-binding protein
MKPAHRPVFVLHEDARFQMRLRQAAERDCCVRVVASWAALHAELHVAVPSALAVVDPYHGSGARPRLAPELRELLRSNPGVAVLAALEVSVDSFADLRTLGEWGVVQVISLSGDNVGSLARLLTSVRGRRVKALLDRALPANTPARTRCILAQAAEVASASGHATDLARALHVSMRTLLRWCERAEIPPPRQILGWMRILMAAEMLDDPGRSVESIALACGYAADSGLRRALRDFMGSSPKLLRKQGAFATASEAFTRALRAPDAGWLGDGGTQRLAPLAPSPVPDDPAHDAGGHTASSPAKALYAPARETATATGG